jgi:hypothetical protein
MIQRYPIESQRINWRHVAEDQWTATVTGVAEGYGVFRFPIGAGVYVVVGQEGIRKFTEGWASNKAILDLFGKN